MLSRDYMCCQMNCCLNLIWSKNSTLSTKLSLWENLKTKLIILLKHFEGRAIELNSKMSNCDEKNLSGQNLDYSVAEGTNEDRKKSDDDYDYKLRIWSQMCPPPVSREIPYFPPGAIGNQLLHPQSI